MMSHAERPYPFFRHWLPLIIIATSLAMRAGLALQGGQYFFGDEGRYDRGIQLYRALVSVNLTGIRDIVALPEHTLFPWVGAAATALQHALAALVGKGDWDRHQEYIAFTISYAALALGLCSTMNLWLLYRLALAAGAGAAEAAWSLALMATANSGFYYARHLLPYDSAITAMLAALLLGLSPPTLARAAGSGMLAGIVYHLYNGYWFVLPVIALLYVSIHRAHPRRVTLIAGYATGALTALALPLALGGFFGGIRYFELMAAFSRSVTQGVFAEGWSLPWEYFWHAEGLVGAAVAVLTAFALIEARLAAPPIPARVTAALLGLAAAYCLLVLASVGLERFVVYARTVKPMVPAFCLLGGWAIARLLSYRPSLNMIAGVTLGLAAALNLSPHFNRVFPREIEIEVLRNFGNPKHTLSMAGSLYIPLALPVTRPDLALVNAQLLYPVRGPLPYPAGTTVLRLAHPLSYPPFQYESHTPRERVFLRAHDISIRLIKLADPRSIPSDLPLQLRYRNDDRPSGR